MALWVEADILEHIKALVREDRHRSLGNGNAISWMLNTVLSHPDAPPEPLEALEASDEPLAPLDPEPESTDEAASATPERVAIVLRRATLQGLARRYPGMDAADALVPLARDYRRLRAAAVPALQAPSPRVLCEVRQDLLETLTAEVQQARGVPTDFPAALHWLLERGRAAGDLIPRFEASLELSRLPHHPAWQRVSLPADFEAELRQQVRESTGQALTHTQTILWLYLSWCRARRQPSRLDAPAHPNPLGAWLERPASPDLTAYILTQLNRDAEPHRIWPDTRTAEARDETAAFGRPLSSWSVRRTLYVHHTGHDLTPQIALGPRCEQPECVQPEHQTTLSLSELRFDVEAFEAWVRLLHQMGFSVNAITWITGMAKRHVRRLHPDPIVPLERALSGTEALLLSHSHGLLAEGLPGARPGHDQPVEPVSLEQIWAALDQSDSGLSRRERAVLRGLYVESQSEQDLSLTLGITPGHVGRLKRDALRKIQPAPLA